MNHLALVASEASTRSPEFLERWVLEAKQGELIGHAGFVLYRGARLPDFQIYGFAYRNLHYTRGLLLAFDDQLGRLVQEGVVYDDDAH